MKFYERTVPFEDIKLIRDRNFNTKYHFREKIIENLGQSQRKFIKFDERTASLKTKVTSRLIE